MKQVCLTGEVGKTYSALKTAAGAVYPAFSCEATPANEPTCTPKRPASVMGSTVYTGDTSATDSDGDGIPDAMDKCPNTFDPIRPLDNGVEADTDGDGLGDACDPCPLDANSTMCTTVDPNDRDHDGVANSLDNCPDLPNPDQSDMDGDGKGDACDACPTTANPGAAGCPASIYAIKSGMLTTGTAVEVNHALVTGVGANGFFVQVRSTDVGYSGPDYSGLFVYAGTASPFLTSATVGARLTIDGSIDVFGGEIELDNLTGVTLESAGPDAAPVPITAAYAEVATGGTRQAKLEGVVIALPAATVTAVDAAFGEATLTAADSTTLIMDDIGVRGQRDGRPELRLGRRDPVDQADQRRLGLQAAAAQRGRSRPGRTRARHVWPGAELCEDRHHQRHRDVSDAAHGHAVGAGAGRHGRDGDVGHHRRTHGDRRHGAQRSDLGHRAGDRGRAGSRCHAHRGTRHQHGDRACPRARRRTRCRRR